MNIFQYLSYRSLLKEQCLAWKKTHRGASLQRLAEEAGIQSPYLSNAFKERAHLNADQIFSLAQILHWDDETLNFCLLLMEWERAGNPKRKLLLKQKIDRTKKDKLESKANLKKEILQTSTEDEQKFFLNPYYSIIHAFMGVAKFSANPQLVGKVLGLKDTQFQNLLKDLLTMQFLEKKSGAIVKKRKNFHLPKESALCGPHLQLLSVATNQQLQRITDDEKYNFSVTFTGDAETKEKVQREFLDFLRKIEGIVKEAPSNEVYGLRFDLFSWT